MTFCAPLAAPTVLTFERNMGRIGVSHPNWTVTLPLTLALIRLAKPVPGSKNPEPDEEVPVMFTLAEACPAASVPPEVGFAGGERQQLRNLDPVRASFIPPLLDRPHGHVVHSDRHW